jgi:hypothetical protein
MSVERERERERERYPKEISKKIIYKIKVLERERNR